MMNQEDILILFLFLMLTWLFLLRLRTRKIKYELQSIMDKLDPIAMIDTNYNILRVNELFASALDKPYESLIGKKCYRVFENRLMPCPGCQLYKAVLEKKSQHVPEYEWERDGHKIVYDIAFHPIMDSKGKVTEIVEVKTDHTQLHTIKLKTEEQKLLLENKTQELARKNRAITHARNELQATLEERNKELEMAREIQLSLLPERLPRLPGVKFWATYQPIHSVGGDIYDFIHLADHKLGIFIADVSGHGLAAAFVAALTRMSLYNNVKRYSSPVQLFQVMNQDLRQQLKTGHFLTGFYGVFDLKDNTLTYVRASHPHPIVIRKDGSAERLDSKGMFLGIMAQPNYSQETVSLGRGDRIFFFTDGCFEIGAKDQERISYKKFADLVSECGTMPLEAVYGAVNLKLSTMVPPEVSAEDDKTFIGMEITNQPIANRFRYLIHFDKEDNIRRHRISKRKEMDFVLDKITHQLEHYSYKERIILNICNSVQEIVVNAFTHGHGWNESLKMSIAWSVTSRNFKFSVTDKGPGFDMRNYMGNPKSRHKRGHGLLLVRTYMDDVYFDNFGRTVTVVKYRSKN
jgi:serine phosphatase RsbU (regulator of sigma subunit)/anti-sigma regulatory factor (Ser/Thr protein kinase)